jgi:Protein of unknown function (DUF5661)
MSKEKIFTSKEAKEIGEILRINWSKFNIEQFRMGMMVELEHGIADPDTDVTNNDPLVTGKIALAHLTEYPDYYTRLEKMEDEAEEYWESHSTGIKETENEIGTEKIFTAENDDNENDSTVIKEQEKEQEKDITTEGIFLVGMDKKY